MIAAIAIFGSNATDKKIIIAKRKTTNAVRAFLVISLPHDGPTKRVSISFLATEKVEDKTSATREDSTLVNTPV